MFRKDRSNPFYNGNKHHTKPLLIIVQDTGTIHRYTKNNLIILREMMERFNY